MRPRVNPTLLGLWTLQQGRCAYCSRMMCDPRDRIGPADPTLRSTIDHMQPLCKGGRDDLKNRVACCDRCNQQKGNLDAATFVRVRLNPTMLAEARRQANQEREAELHASR